MKRQLLLYTGLGLLALSFAVRRAGAEAYVFRILFGAAVAFKALFLIRVFRAKGFRGGRGLYFILAGVALILLSIPFRTILPLPALQKTLFYTALFLKATGLCLMIRKGKTNSKRIEDDRQNGIRE